MSRQRIVITSLIAAVAFISGGWFMQQESRAGTSVYQQARLFDDVLSHVSDYYVDSLDERQLYRMAIDGMLAELRDPYTGFLDGRELRSLNEQTTGNYGGVGLQIEYRDGAIVVVGPLPDSPGERAGIQTGDRIVVVDDSSVAAWNQERAVRALRGQPGTQVRLRLIRPGLDEPLSYTLTRAQIHSRSVSIAMLLDGGVGYIELNRGFSQATAQELTFAIDSLRAAGMRSLILDMRWNPGGLLEEGVAVADLFLDPNQQIVATRGRAPGATRTVSDRNPQRYSNLPLVVLVNGASASATEIVAGALQDHDRAVVVGTTSYGKGLVQSVFRLSNDASLKLTTSKWFTPSGRSIQRPLRAEIDRDPDEEITRADTAAVDTFRTDRGRPIRGGGGITPDVIVLQDSSLTAMGQRLQTALGRNVPKYRDALAAFALTTRSERPVASPMFEVTPAMREQFLTLLRQRGVELDRATVDATWPFISRQMGSQVARFAFGRTGELRRLAGDDPVLATASRLAARARTPAELFQLAERTGAAQTQRN